MFSCSSTKNGTMNQNQSSVGIPSPPAIVYKTKADYFDKVPVTLSDDKTKVIAFPAQSDIRINNNFTYPTKLNDGYLLDNRGISSNTAFLKFSYDDYFTMDNVPTAESLMNYILDDRPFTEFYEIGKLGDYKNPIKELNALIDKEGLKKISNQAAKN
jgi:hypothetical protein